MTWLLDTNAVVALLRGSPSLMAERVSQHNQAEICISTIVMHKLFFGAFRSDRVDCNLVRLHSLNFERIAFETDDALEAAAIRSHLARLGTPIGPYDTLIAGQARARNLVLVTRNTAEFARVPDLRMENWEAA